MERFWSHLGSPDVKEVLPEVRDNQSTTAAGLPLFHPSLPLYVSPSLFSVPHKRLVGGGAGDSLESGMAF